MAKGDLIFGISFNGQQGDTEAIGEGATAQIVDGDFIEGKFHKAAYFGGAGYAEVLEQLVPLGSEYTFTFWVKAEMFIDGPTASWALFKFEGDDDFIYLDLKSDLTSWNYVGIVQSETGVAAFVNGEMTDSQLFPAGWGKPTGWCIVNDNPFDDAGYTTIEDLNVYEGTDAVITDPPTEMADVQYFINGTLFKSLGVEVSGSKGIQDNLNMKDPVIADWPGLHGEILDLSAPRYQARNIELSCFIRGVTRDEFIDRVATFIKAFVKPGLQELIINAHSTKPLVYYVYLPESINLEKKFRTGQNYGTFTLRLREPQPVKRILRFQGPGTASVSFSSSTALSIYWGDGSNPDENVYGSGVSRSHNYGQPYTFYIVIMGVIEEVTDFNTNAQVIWSKLP